jgi:hypothetical protein
MSFMELRNPRIDQAAQLVLDAPQFLVEPCAVDPDHFCRDAVLVLAHADHDVSAIRIGKGRHVGEKIPNAFVIPAGERLLKSSVRLSLRPNVTKAVISSRLIWSKARSIISSHSILPKWAEV